MSDTPVAPAPAPALSITITGRAIEIPSDHTPPRFIHHHGHADLIFVVAASAKNIISANIKKAARTANIKLAEHKAGITPLDKKDVEKYEKVVQDATEQADKRFVMVTLPAEGRTKLEVGDAFDPTQALVDFELPVGKDGTVDGEFRVEIMAVDLHDSDTRRAFHDLFNQPDEDLLAQVHKYMAKLDDERHKTLDEVKDLLAEATHKLVGEVAAVAVPAATGSLSFLTTALADVEKIVMALHKAHIASDVLGRVVITGTFVGGDKKTVSFTQPALSATATGDVTAAPTATTATEQVGTKTFSASHKHVFQGSPHVTPKVETNIIVSVRV